LLVIGIGALAVASGYFIFRELMPAYVAPVVVSLAPLS
jgi:hypothetical protein